MIVALSRFVSAGAFCGLATLFAASPTFAADLYAKAPLASRPAPLSLPAVDGINGKLEALGGTIAERTVVGVRGALSVPLTNQFGLQIDGAAGSFDADGFGAVAAHGFWRDPSRGLVGLYGSHTHWARSGGLHISQVGVEGELYLGNFSIEAMAGIEGGNSQTWLTPVAGGGVFTSTLAVGTRFFDRVDVAYYINENLRVSVGHRYEGGLHAAALGGEWMFNPGWRTGTSLALFAEGRIGEHDHNGIFGGVKVYFGQKDKTLIRRHREDDPQINIPNTLGNIASNANNSTTYTPPPAAPPVIVLPEPD